MCDACDVCAAPITCPLSKGARDPASPIVVWGCSATLRRHDALSLGAVFDKVSSPGHKSSKKKSKKTILLFQIVYEHSLLDMWSEGYLARPRVVHVQTTADLRDVRTASRTKDFAVGALARRTNTPQRNRQIVAAWLQHAHGRRQSTLVFGVDVRHILELEACFREAGVEAHAVHGRTPPDQRALLVENFRQRQFPVLINCSVFTEGTDIPGIDCLVLARPTRSAVLFQQMLGRGLRLHPDKTDCLCLDVCDIVDQATIITMPTLMGLVPSFDARGGDIVGVYEKMVKLAQVGNWGKRKGGGGGLIVTPYNHAERAAGGAGVVARGGRGVGGKRRGNRVAPATRARHASFPQHKASSEFGFLQSMISHHAPPPLNSLSGTAINTDRNIATTATSTRTAPQAAQLTTGSVEVEGNSFQAILCILTRHIPSRCLTLSTLVTTMC